MKGRPARQVKPQSRDFLNARTLRSSKRIATFVAVATVLLIWALAFIGIRAAGRDLSAGPLAFGRLLIGSVALGAVVTIRRERLPKGPALKGSVACGLLWFGLYNVILNAGERQVDAGIAAMLVNVGPILIAILAGAFLAEGLPGRLVLGCAVSFAGATIIGVSVSQHGIHAAWGVVLCLVAALSYAGGVVTQKPALRHASPLAVTWIACTAGMLACLPYAPRFFEQFSHASASAVEWLFYLGLFSSSIAFILWAYVLRRTSAGRMGTTTYLVPPLAVLLGWLVLGEVPPLLSIPGGLLCLIGVAISRAPARPRRISPTAP